MTTKEKVKIIIIEESLWKSFLKDTYTFIVLGLVVSAGVYMDSLLLQIIGGLAWLFFIMGNSGIDDKKCYSYDEARQRIDDLEKGIKQ